MRVKRQLAVALLASTLAAPALAGPRVDYMLQCRGCHGPDGAGIPNAAPSLRQLTALLRMPQGRAYLIGVPGVSRSELDDAATAALLNWIVANLADERIAGAVAPFTTAEVSAHRRPALLNPAAERARVLAP